jgi:cytochrome c-type biogenesis protein
MAGVIATLPSSLLAALPVAVAAGFVSFVSPCVLPLLPGYLAFLGGAAGNLEGRRGRGRALMGSLAFVLGFAVVFVSAGALFGSFGASLRGHQRFLEVVFGAFTVLLGLFFAGWWPKSWLSRERRIHRLPRATVVGAFFLGVLFAFGWTPCVGPTLAAILGLASSSTQASALRGSILALFYCFGLGIPFVVAALATEWATTASGWLRRHQRLFARIGGVLLIAIGVLEVSGWWHTFVVWLSVHFPASSSLL